MESFRLGIQAKLQRDPCGLGLSSVFTGRADILRRPRALHSRSWSLGTWQRDAGQRARLTAASCLCSEKARKRVSAAGEDRAHDLRIMRPTRCQLRYCRSWNGSSAWAYRASYSGTPVGHGRAVSLPAVLAALGGRVRFTDGLLFWALCNVMQGTGHDRQQHRLCWRRPKEEEECMRQVRIELTTLGL